MILEFQRIILLSVDLSKYIAYVKKTLPNEPNHFIRTAQKSPPAGQ